MTENRQFAQDNAQLVLAEHPPVNQARHRERLAESRAEDDPQERRRIAGHQKCGGGWRVLHKRIGSN